MAYRADARVRKLKEHLRTFNLNIKLKRATDKIVVHIGGKRHMGSIGVKTLM